MNKSKNRWLIATSAVGIHLSIGSVYAWSVFTNPLHEAFQWSLTEISLTFSIAILFLGLSAAFMGHFVERYGPRASGLFSAIFFGIGMTGSGFAVHMSSLPLLYLFYGVLAGIGLGVGYIAPVSTLVKWFPDRRGLATGLAIMGFGFASLICSPIIQFLIEKVNIANTFYILGISYFIIMVISSLYLSPPTPDDVKQFDVFKTKQRKIPQDLSQLTANEAIKTRRFYYLWLMLFINITCGIAIISVASPLAQESVGFTAGAAATLVGILGAFNGLGRIGWASFSDYIGNTEYVYDFFQYTAHCISFTPLFKRTAHLFNRHGDHLYVLWRRICFNSSLYWGFVWYKAAWCHTRIYFDCLVAAGLAGPLFSSFIRDITGNYTQSLMVFSGLFFIAFIISLLIRKDIQQLREKIYLLLPLSQPELNLNLTESQSKGNF